MEPSEAYMPFIEQMKVKVHMAKIVIEFLTNNQDAAYEDLLNKVQVIFPLPSLPVPMFYMSFDPVSLF